MRFSFKADIVFEANDLEDAFSKLSNEFYDLAETGGDMDDKTWFEGEMEMEPVYDD